MELMPRALQSHIYEDDPSLAGSMYCPIICGTDKTTVSVATGHVEYHPGYISIGNLHNNVRRAHRNGVVPFIFLPIPKSKSGRLLVDASTLIVDHR